MARRNTTELGPDPIDIHVGKRLRLRRLLVGASQEQLAADIGVTFQQIQKYERGANRVSASMLWRTAAALKCPVQYFFQDMDATGDIDMTRHEWMLDVIRALAGMDDRARVSAINVVRALAKGPVTQTVAA